MTWEQIVAIITVILSAISLLWHMYASQKLHKNNIEVENVKSYYQLKQSKYALEFKAYEELSRALARMISNTGAFIMMFINTEDATLEQDECKEFCNKVMKESTEFICALKGYAPFIPSDIYDSFYNMRDLCSKGIGIFCSLGSEEVTMRQRQQLKGQALQIKNELIEKHKRFNDELAMLINVRIANTRRH